MWIADVHARSDKGGMEGLGERLKARDYATLVRLCRLLATTPDSLLAYSEQVAEHDKVTKLRDQITATAQGMDEPTLRTVVALMTALVGPRD